MTDKSARNYDSAGISAGFSELLTNIGQSQTLEEVASHLTAFEKYLPYQIIHIGTFRLHDVPVKDVIYSREIDNKNVKPNDFSDEIKWAVCTEAEALLRPFDLLTHAFTQVNDEVFSELRNFAAHLGIRQIMIVPVIVRETSTIVIYNFPDANYSDNSEDIMSWSYRIVTSIFDRFPSLLSWTEEAKLSEREKQVLRYTARGMNEPEIASQLNISRNTVRNHLANARVKLDARNKVHAVSIAARAGEIDLRRIDEG